ncbi:uncharacterized protein LOC118438503 [Folsomia candida]|nr:uncharacterized protein LOC118438503 [Folsomia candida]
MTEAIYIVKTPSKGYDRLMSLFLDEYRTFLKPDLDHYKIGMQNLLKAGSDFGWIDDGEVTKLISAHELDKISTSSDPNLATKQNAWNRVEQYIKEEAKTKSKSSESHSTPGVPNACTSGNRRRRSANSDCVFFLKNKLPETDDVKKIPISDTDDNTIKQNLDKDGGNKKPIIVDDPQNHPVKPVHLDSIDSRKLSNLLSTTDRSTDADSIDARKRIVDFATQNQDKLVGTDVEVKKAKAQLAQANLESHNDQNSLARGILHNPTHLSAKVVSKHGKVKVGMTKIAAKVSTLTSGTSKVSGAYGKVMLAKGVVTSLRHGDVQSLAIMGGRIGLDYALQGVEKLGRLVAKKATTKFATKLGSSVLGKMGGPVGALADVGLNIWSITKSAKILNDPNASKFDQNDAIADIVVDSIDIAVTAVAAVASLVFPPLAPIFAAVAFIINVVLTGFLAFYKAANHVDRINSELPLLDYEKSTEYWRHVTSSETSTYIQELIEEKRANNIVVNATIEFLKNNTEYVGKIFPARTFHNPAGDCFLEEKLCNHWLHSIPDCYDWQRKAQCYGANRRCFGPYGDRICQGDSRTHGVVPIVGHSVTETRCNCEKDPPPVWRHEVPDSTVDLRIRQNVYQQRSSPDIELGKDHEFGYICKPSSLKDEGDRVSKRDATTDYLCLGAIGIQRSSGAGKFLLIDLGEGKDSVRLNEGDKTDALFIVWDGTKQFYGGGGDDTFHVNGPCDKLTGTLNGTGYRDQGNTLVVDQSCGRSLLTIDLMDEKLSENGLSLSITNFEKLVGRANKPDNITASCETKFISGGGGGSHLEPHLTDSITIPKCGPSFSATILASGTTLIDARSFADGHLYLAVQDFTRFYARTPTTFGVGTLLSQIEGSLTTAKFVSESQLMFKFEEDREARFSFVETHQETVSELECSSKAPNTPQFVIVDPRSQLKWRIVSNFESKLVQILVDLDAATKSRNVSGFPTMSNIFRLLGPGAFSVYGSPQHDDHFHLGGASFSGNIDGRGGQNSVLISPSISGTVVIDFSQGLITGQNVGNVTFKNIHNIVGRSKETELVTTTCDTAYVEMAGGTDQYPDVVTIPRQGCPHKLLVSAKGKSNVVVMDGKESDVISITVGSPDSKCTGNDEERFDVSITTGENVLSSDYASVKIYRQVQDLMVADRTRLLFFGGSRLTFSGILPSALVFQEERGHLSFINLQIDDDTEQLSVSHELNSTEKTRLKRDGAPTLPNIFRLQAGNWHAIGGEHDDRFIFEMTGSHGFFTVDGKGGSNSLIIGESVLPRVEMDMVQGRLRFEGDNNDVASVSKVNSIFGRPGAKETIIAGCNTDWISLGGGGQLDHDLVQVPSMRCSDRKLTVIASGTTVYESRAETGTYQLYLQPDQKNRLQFGADLLLRNSTVFTISVQMLSYKLSDYRVIPSRNKGMCKIELLFQERQNRVSFNLDFGGISPDHKFLPNFNVMFTDANYSSNGNVLVDVESGDIQILHILENSTKHNGTFSVRRGAVGARNVFRINSDNWEVHGGKANDAFVLNDTSSGRINGHGGVNSLIFMDSYATSIIDVNLPNKTVTFDNVPSLEVENIQIVNGRKGKSDLVTTACDTKLVVTEGGESPNRGDLITVPSTFCRPEVTFILEKFTTLENLATRGNFTYHIRSVDNVEISYHPTNATMHSFRFELPLADVSHVEMMKKVGHLEITMGSGSVHHFPLNFHNMPTFHIGQDAHLLTDLDLRYEDGDITAITAAKGPYSGDIIGIRGAGNDISVDTSADLDTILGREKDDNIFLFDVQTVSEIDGGLGRNQLQFLDSLHPGRPLEIDLRDKIGAIYFLDGQNENNYENEEFFVTSLQNIGVVQGRESSFDKVILGCGTESVSNVDLVLVQSVTCERYQVTIQVGMRTRVVFELDDEPEVGENGTTEESNSTEIYDQKEISANKIKQDSTQIKEIDRGEDDTEIDEDDVIDDAIDDKAPLNPSTFYYHFTTVKTFDIETTEMSRLWRTRHIFLLNFTLSDLTSIQFANSRLIYTIQSRENVSFSHALAPPDPTEMFHFRPEFTTGDGFLIRITRYGEIIISFGNLREYLELEIVQNRLIPTLTKFAESLGVSFIIETGTDFIYSGNEREVNILTNRADLRSHLVGFNQTTYVIFDLVRNTYIYPMNVKEGSLHVVDLSEMVVKIRNVSGTKYVPSVQQVGTDLVIIMSGYEDQYPARIIIVNGTVTSKYTRVLLNSIVMDILPVQELFVAGTDVSRRKRDVVDTKNLWELVPRPIEIPAGFVYLLAAEDMEDGVVIREEGKTGIGINSSFQNFDYSRDKNDLLVTNIGGIEGTEGDVEATTFIIYDYFDQNSGKVINSAKINLGQTTALVSAERGAPVDFDTNAKIPILYYADILETYEDRVLQDFPEIEKKFEVGLVTKLERSGLLAPLFWGCVGSLVILVGVLVMAFLKKKSATGKYPVSSGTREKEGVPLVEMQKMGKEPVFVKIEDKKLLD